MGRPSLSVGVRKTEIDLLRSLAIVLMIVYHAAYDLGTFAGWQMNLLQGGWFILQRITVNLFLLLVGISAVLARERLIRNGAGFSYIAARFARRGMLILACSLIVSLATYIFVGPLWVRFGILHLIGLSIIVLPAFLPLGTWNLIPAGILFVLGKWVSTVTSTSVWLLPFGVRTPEFASVDYVPFLPWFASILVGIVIGNLLYRKHLLSKHIPDSRTVRLLTLPGRHSLLIYMIHQPILLLLLHLAIGKP